MKRLGILGATGAVGSVLTGDLLRSRLLEPGDELILVGHGDAGSNAKLFAMRMDLLDAFDEKRVRISFCPDPSTLEADLVVMAAGCTVSAEHPSRRDLAAVNFPLFQQIARTCVARLPSALFIIISNPVELAVEVFSRCTAPQRVLGMGAQQDSLRFARAVADKLGLSRHEVVAGVAGEHGQAMLPLWSSVELDTDDDAARAALLAMRERCTAQDLSVRVKKLQQKVTSLLQTGDVEEAYRATLSEEPDARIFVEPFITAHTLHSTPHATSNATLQCLAATLTLQGALVYAQVRSEGQHEGIDGVCGLPVYLNCHGWRPAPETSLTAEEIRKLKACQKAITVTNASLLAGDEELEAAAA